VSYYRAWSIIDDRSRVSASVRVLARNRGRATRGSSSGKATRTLAVRRQRSGLPTDDSTPIEAIAFREMSDLLAISDNR